MVCWTDVGTRVMTAVRMWAAADLRSRWRSWVLLGLLAGVTFGVVAAGVAGARRTTDAVPDFVAASGVPTAAVLANDPSFDDASRAAVANLPEVSVTQPFEVAFGLAVMKPAQLGQESPSLLPVTPGAARVLSGVLVDGRYPYPQRADEVVVDENARKRYGLGVGSTMLVGQSAKTLGVGPDEPADPSMYFTQPLRVVGISKSVSSDPGWTASSGFYEKYAARVPGFVNQFVGLRHGESDLPRLRSDVAKIAGRPINVEPTSELFGIRKAINVTNVERAGLLLFSLAALIGGGLLVGQALVRSVTAGAADLPTWRAMGADRSIARGRWCCRRRSRRRWGRSSPQSSRLRCRHGSRSVWRVATTSTSGCTSTGR